MTNAFTEEVRRRQAASFGGLKVVTRDAHTCQKHLRAALKGDVLLWSTASGLWRLKENGDMTALDKALKDPHDFVLGLRERLNETDKQTTFVAVDLDFWLEDDPIIRRHVIEAVQVARNLGHLLIYMSRHEKFHSELGDEVSVVKHPLPDREASREEMTGLLSKNKVPTEDLEGALDAVQGLTSSRQADAFSLGIVDCLVRKSEGVAEPVLDVGILRRYKEEEIGKLDFLQVSEPEKSFDDLIGHAYLKDWLLRRRHGFAPEAREHALPVPKGMLLVGPPGTGKSRFAEAVAREWKVPFLTLDVGSIFGSMLGESEANVTHAIEVAERMSPCVMLVDEVERAFGGEGKGDKDGGTTERVIGKFLTWLSLKKDPVFVIFTSNVAENLPAAMIRKGRLDEIFFLDFSSEKEREAVFRYYLQKGPSEVPDDVLKELVAQTDSWAPAEIEAAVGAARYTAFEDQKRALKGADIINEIDKTVPVSESMSRQVENMRTWAKKYARLTEYDQRGNRPWSNSAGSRTIEV
jgi:AAA+ superfamily predicted ATPase